MFTTHDSLFNLPPTCSLLFFRLTSYLKVRNRLAVTLLLGGFRLHLRKLMSRLRTCLNIQKAWHLDITL